MKLNRKLISIIPKEENSLYSYSNNIFKNKKNKITKSLSSETLMFKHNKNKINLKLKKPNINLPLISSNNNPKKNVLILNNNFNTKTISSPKNFSNGFVSRKPLESNKKYKNNKIKMNKNKSLLNIYNIRLKNEFQENYIRPFNIKFYNLINKKSFNSNLNELYTNYLENYNNNIISMYLNNKSKEINEYNITSPVRTILNFNNEKIKNSYKIKPLNENKYSSIIEEKRKIKKLIKKCVFHNVFFKWRKNYYSLEDYLINDYSDYLILLIKNDVKELCEFLKINSSEITTEYNKNINKNERKGSDINENKSQKKNLNKSSHKNEDKNKNENGRIKRNKSSIISREFSSLYKIINNIEENKMNLSDNMNFSNSLEIINFRNLFYNFLKKEYKKILKENNISSKEIEKIDEVDENENYMHESDGKNSNINEIINRENKKVFNKLSKIKKKLKILNSHYEEENNIIKADTDNIDDIKFLKFFEKNYSSLSNDNDNKKVNRKIGTNLSMFLNKEYHRSSHYNRNIHYKNKRNSTINLKKHNGHKKDNGKDKDKDKNNNDNIKNNNNIYENRVDVHKERMKLKKIKKLRRVNTQIIYSNHHNNNFNLNIEKSSLRRNSFLSNYSETSSIFYDNDSNYDNDNDSIILTKEKNKNILEHNIKNKIKKKKKSKFWKKKLDNSNDNEEQNNENNFNDIYQRILKLKKNKGNRKVDNIRIRRNKLNYIFNSYRKNFKERKSVDYIYIKDIKDDDDNINNNHNYILENNFINKLRFNKRHKSWSNKNKKEVNNNIMSHHIINNIHYNSSNKYMRSRAKNHGTIRIMNKNKGKKKNKKKKNKEKNVANDNEKEKEYKEEDSKINVDNVNENDNNNNNKNNSDNNNDNNNDNNYNYFNENIIKPMKSSKMVYQFNKDLEFLSKIPSETKEDLEKEEEIKKKHKEDAINILMEKQKENLVIKKEKRHRYSIIIKKKLQIYKPEKEKIESKTPPASPKKIQTQVRNSETYLSNILKKQLIFNNSHLYKIKKKKTKIYKDIDGVLSLIPQEEKDNIIIQEIKDKNKYKKGINGKSNKDLGNLSPNTELNEEEESKEENESNSSYNNNNNRIRRKRRNNISSKKGAIYRFLHNYEEETVEKVKEEDEDEIKERKLMQKLYNFFEKIQKLKNCEDKNEVDHFIKEELDRNGFNERRQRILRLNSFMDDINYYRDIEKLIKPKIKYLSPISFSSNSSSKNKNKNKK